MMTRRPRRHDPEIVAKAIETLLPAVLEWTRMQPDAEVRQQMLRSADEDGYKFARNLDDRFGWSVDAELVEILAGYSTYEARTEAVKAWVAANAITIPFAIGDTIIARGETARIVALRPDTAECIAQPLKSDGHSYGADGGWIIPAEDARAAGEIA